MATSPIDGPSIDRELRAPDPERQADIRHESPPLRCFPPLHLLRLPRWLPAFLHREPPQEPVVPRLQAAAQRVPAAQRLPVELWGQVIELSVQDGPGQAGAWRQVNSVAKSETSSVLFKRPQGRETGRQYTTNELKGLVKDTNLSQDEFVAWLYTVVQDRPDVEIDLRQIQDRSRCPDVLDVLAKVNQLKSLSLNLGSSHVPDLAARVPLLVASNAGLERLTVHLKGSTASHANMAHLASMQGLTELDMNGAVLTPGCLAILLAADAPLQRTLRSLDLSFALPFDWENFEVLANNTTLRRLNLSINDLRDDHAAMLARNITLDYIDVSRNARLTDAGRLRLAREGRTVVG